MEGCDPATVLRADGLLSKLKKVLTERTFNAEIGIYSNAAAEQTADLHHSDLSQKTVCEDSGKLVLSIPYDQQGRFDQQFPRDSIMKSQIKRTNR